jgi:hypothetical protein
MKHPWICFGVILMALMAPGSSLCAENAALPYEYVYNILKTKERLARTYTNLNVYLYLRSQNSNVKVTDLDASLQTQSGSRAILLEADGEFNLPLNETWLAEKAAIVVNQPKGTMVLGVMPRFSTAGAANMMATNMPYSRMTNWCADLEKIQKDLAKVAPNMTIQSPSGMRFIFSAGKVGQVILQSKTQRQPLKPEADGSIILPVTEALFKENPTILTPLLPERVEIVFKKAAN